MVSNGKAYRLGACVATRAGDGQGVRTCSSDCCHNFIIGIGDGLGIVGVFGQQVAVVVVHSAVHIDGTAGIHINVIHAGDAGVDDIAVVQEAKQLHFCHGECLKAVVVPSTD